MRNSQIIDLLRDNSSEGFPADYLIARVRGRRSTLIRDWQSLLLGVVPPGGSEEEIWGALLEELEWLYRQMNSRLRKTFAPMFLLFEVKTIVLALRNKAVEKSVTVELLLERSLLSDSLKQVLRSGTDVRTTIAGLSQDLAVAAESFRELDSAYAEEGLKGFEDSLMRVFLEHVARQRLRDVIEAFFETLIDLRNTVILYKHLRWKMEDGSPFIAGGGVEPARFREILGRKDKSGFDALVRRFTGLKSAQIATDEAALEAVLLRSLTAKLHRIARESEDVGLIADYVWRRYVQARNLAVLHHGKGLDADTLEKELIL